VFENLAVGTEGGDVEALLHVLPVEDFALMLRNDEDVFLGPTTAR
jgi:hypothetical protein